MRLFRTLPALGLILGARASRLDVRDTTDVCATLDTELKVPDPQGASDSVGMIDVCLCISGISAFIQTDAVGMQAVTIAGEVAVTQILTDLINNDAPQNCYYPDYSTPVCVDDDPCGFQCTGGFTPSPANNPTQCKCEQPNQICNGQCQPKGACPSQAPQSDRRRWAGSGSCIEMGRGWAACGVYGGGPRSWECIYTERDLESCGGCVVPLNAYSPKGTDCTAVPGVADVACLGGACVVRRCMKGLVPTFDASSCVPEHHHHQSEIESGPYNDVPARIYGLEHVPLERA